MRWHQNIIVTLIIVFVTGIGHSAVIHVPGDQPNIQAGIDAAMDGDTVLVADPLGNYYLSQIAAGQAVDSPCFDMGSDLAENLCFSIPDSQICMNEFTTRTDGFPDDLQVDIGYHYTVSCNHTGDINDDAYITAADAALAFGFALGIWTSEYMEFCAADCDGNGMITAGDAQMIFMTALGMGTCLDPL
jgi:hypothetical protein